MRMDPEVEEVPLQSGDQRRNAQHAPEVIVVDDGNSSQGAPQDVPLEHLEKALENTCETLNNISETVMNFSYDSQHVLFSKINEFVRDLREVDRWARRVTAVVPADVIDAIDKGRNPEVSTAHMLESCAEANNVAIGKLSAVEHFRDELKKALLEAQSQGKLQSLNKDELVGKTVGDMDVDAGVGNPSSVNPSNGF